ncbi:hypothetical protein HaLaN_29411, partial [Haematococcus lacustris]
GSQMRKLDLSHIACTPQWQWACGMAATAEWTTSTLSHLASCGRPRPPAATTPCGLLLQVLDDADLGEIRSSYVRQQVCCNAGCNTQHVCCGGLAATVGCRCGAVDEQQQQSEGVLQCGLQQTACVAVAGSKCVAVIEPCFQHVRLVNLNTAQQLCFGCCITCKNDVMPQHD